MNERMANFIIYVYIFNTLYENLKVEERLWREYGSTMTEDLKGIVHSIIHISIQVLPATMSRWDLSALTDQFERLEWQNEKFTRFLAWASDTITEGVVEIIQS